jgi:integrase
MDMLYEPDERALIASSRREQASQMADEAIRATAFARYQAKIAAQTRRRQRADLALWTTFLIDVVEYPQRQGKRSGGLIKELLLLHLTLYRLQVMAWMTEPQAWEGITFGLVEMFKQWQLHMGYRIGAVNVRTATVRKYIGLAAEAGVISREYYAVVKEMAPLIEHQEGLHIDEQRAVTSIGRKKANPTELTSEQVERLISAQPPTPQGSRDAFLLVLLFHYILRAEEAAHLKLSNYNRRTGKLTFYRSKTDNFTTLLLEPEDQARAELYFTLCKPEDEIRNPERRLIIGGNNRGEMFGTMGEHSISERVRKLALRTLGIDYVSSHDARHHGSTEYAEGGTDAKTLQEIGGWTNVLTPLNKYVRAAKVANQNAKRGVVE